MDAEIKQDARRSWLIDILVGGGIGVVVGAIVAVNFVIFIGTEDGYQTSIGELFDYNLAAGVITVAILVLSPVAGVWMARRRRKRS